MKLEFTHFDAGHHGHKPDPIEANDVDHAFRIFSAVACALCQGEKVLAKVEDGRGDVVARFEAVDDESPSTDYPEPGDIVCSECGAFWSLCGCVDGGPFPDVAAMFGPEDRDPEMIEAMNANLKSGAARLPWIDREAFETLQGFAGLEIGDILKAEPAILTPMQDHNCPPCGVCPECGHEGNDPMDEPV